MANRHPDFEYILGEFQRYYCKGEKNCPKAAQEYQAWLAALKLNDSKSYGQSRESFQWAKDMISRFKEDAKNVYYKVLVGFPTKSMNRNVYKERDLVAAAHTLVGKHPSVNHKDEYRLSPTNPHNRWGVVTVVGAAPEDGAIEAILQVPKTAKCPVCNGALLTELIDAKRIYNVSLEGACTGGTSGPDGNNVCDGFEFTEAGFSLLTSDVLPGIPMTKIYPIESFLGFLPTKPSGKRAPIRIVGLKTTTEGELSGMANPDQTVKVVQPDSNGQCPKGMMWSAQVGGCRPIEDNIASTGFDMRPGANKGDTDLRKARADTSRVQFKPEGTEVIQGKEAGKDNSDTANRAMGDPKGGEQSDVGIQTQEMPGGDRLPDGLSGDMLNKKGEAKLAGDMAKLAGATKVLVDAGGSDKLHPSDDDKWKIEGGDFNPTGACPKGMTLDTKTGKCVNAEDDSVDKMGKPPTSPTDQPASKGHNCPPGTSYDSETGWCQPPKTGTGETLSTPDARSLSDNTSPNIMPNDAEPNDLADDCGPGLMRDPKSGLCEPKEGGPGQPASNASDCPRGMVRDPSTGLCTPPEECTPAGTMGDLLGQTRTLLDQGGSTKWHDDNDAKWLIEVSKRVAEAQMKANTLAEYDWDTCIADNMKQYGDMDTAKKVCGSIKYQNQDYTQNHELQLSQALSKVATLEAQLSGLTVEANAKVKGLNALVAKHWEAFQTEKDKRMQLEGRLKQLTEHSDAQDDKNRTITNERVDLETRLARRDRDFTEAQENAARFKKAFETLQTDHETTTEKYRQSLSTNLALNKQITKGNEDYLKLARHTEEVEEALKKATRLARHIVKVRMT